MNVMLIEDFRKLGPLQLGVFTRDWGKPYPHARNDAAARPAQRWSLGHWVWAQIQPGPVRFELGHTGVV